ncbi:hypothetical protein [Kibdelosporangium phytohabitans]|uniref:Alpha-galactosidase NEW3 domain-containing protein n=1 Tax=Kibdelosporangium phytohabitans TaxID=860235 RepID=A0A0N9I073_9PSEU|nr:hypothetical protein [Kibdelosporangium phytohabitans]ALG11441.1 hypothetical protein AOZ06_35335 [Kibdelosporangium phytohabitans]MBE1462781.1 hypothetical protein [Kibdelosporangium phytohabitans]
MAIAMKVTVSPERISLGPGESADVEVTVQNASQVVEHFAAQVVGLPSADLVRCEPDVVKLRPKEVGTLRMQVSVPERGGMVAGPYTLGLVVKSPYSKEVSRCEELPLDVRPAPALTMNVQPEVANGGKVGNYVVNLANEGNMPMAVTLSGSDPENRVGFKFAPREIRLEPGMVAGSQVTVNSDQPLTGQEKRRAATLRANAGETVVEKPVSFVQRPKIRGGWMKFGALAAGLAVLGGATVGGALLLRDIRKPEVSANTSQAAQPLPQPQPNPQQNPQQPPPQQSGPANPASAPPQPPPNPQAPTPAPPGPSGAPAPVPVTTTIDFEQNPATGQPADENDPIESDHYAAKGLTLAALPDRGPIECKNAKQLWIKINRPNPNSTVPVAGAGLYLTTGIPTEARDCNVVPVRMTFAKPATAVNVYFTGLQGTKYTATMVFADGTQLPVEGTATKIGERVPIPFQVPQGGQPVREVIFGLSPGVAPDRGGRTNVLLKGVGFTSVP